jgi:serine phosphatase RsbU (regulator of sigma subunit)
LFSDGVSDAMNAEQERFTVERVRRHLMLATATEPAEIGERLLEDVRRHVAASEQHDDAALVVFRRDPA